MATSKSWRVIPTAPVAFEVEAEAKRQGRSVSNMVTRMLEAHLFEVRKAKADVSKLVESIRATAS